MYIIMSCCSSIVHHYFLLIIIIIKKEYLPSLPIIYVSESKFNKLYNHYISSIDRFIFFTGVERAKCFFTLLPERNLGFIVLRCKDSVVRPDTELEKNGFRQ